MDEKEINVELQEWKVMPSSLREQRRYEIARDCMASMAGSTPDQAFIEAGLRFMGREEASHAEILAEGAVAYADALLARLEKE